MTHDSTNEQRFSYQSALSRTLVVAVSGVLLIESSVLHLWLAATHPTLAWTFAVISVLTLVWMWRDDAQYRSGCLRLSDSQITLELGSRWQGAIARDLVALRLFGIPKKNVRRIGIHLDAPDELLSQWMRPKA